MPNTYLELYLSQQFPNNTFTNLLSLLVVFLGRMLPIIALSPFFGARVLPNPVKLTFAVTMFAIFLPKLLIVTETPMLFNLQLGTFFAKELFIGFALGLLASIPFTVVQSSGMFIDHQRGGASLMVNDPTIQNQSSPLGTLFNMVLIYLFWMIDGPFHFIDAVMGSYDMIPPDQFFSRYFFTDESPFWEVMVQLFNNVMKLAIQLAGPPLIAILMTDFFLGIANRLAPQVQMTFLGMPLKSLLALLIVTLGFKLYCAETIRVSQSWMQLIKQMINWLTYGLQAGG